MPDRSTGIVDAPLPTLDVVYEFATDMWVHDGGSWRMVTVPDDISDDIDARTAEFSTGFGSVRVEVTIGSTTWMTSLFPSAELQAYVLPIKKPVRTAEQIGDGDDVTVTLRLDGY